ncbi:MAG: histidine kinase [Verrucomicrobiales bacterium]|nr:histidine kinase [Verrucomicrobiales bacterium]
MKFFDRKKLFLIAPLLLGLMTFCFFKMQQFSNSDHERYKIGVRQLVQFDTAIHQNVLMAHFHLLGNYDVFSEERIQMEQILRELTRIPSFVINEDRQVVNALHENLSAIIQAKFQAIESFKMQNAVLNNSLQYFPVAVKELYERSGTHIEDGQLEKLLNDSVRLVLVYSLDGNDELAMEVESAVAGLRAWQMKNPEHQESAFVGTLAAHAQSILKRKPKVDSIIRALMTDSSFQMLDQLDRRLDRAFAKSLQQSNQYRFLLYLFCLLLLVGIVCTIFALHAGNRKLDNRVQDRTHALLETNAKLEKEVAERRRAQEELLEAHQKVVEQSRIAGMAEVATSVLHNVGNVLNSVNVTASLVGENLRKSRLADLRRLTQLLNLHQSDLASFLSNGSKGGKALEFLVQLSAKLSAEQDANLAEMQSLQKNIAHIKDIVAMQQSYGKVSGLIETVAITDLIEDTLRMNSVSLARHDLTVVREFSDVPPIQTDKHKVLQILVNLVKNAKNSCDESGRTDKQVTMQVRKGEETIRISVIDNGVGIPADNLTRIFNHGFTTKQDGHGFGLHSGALAARELGGALNVQSDGIGRGATFTLELPCNPPRTQ